VFVILGCALVFCEKIEPIKYLCVFLCTIGVILFYRPGQQSSTIGIILALTSGITYACYIVYLEKSGLNMMHPFKLAFYLSVISSVELFLFSIATNNLILKIKPLGWVLMFVFSFVISIGATILFQM